MKKLLDKIFRKWGYIPLQEYPFHGVIEFERLQVVKLIRKDSRFIGMERKEMVSELLDDVQRYTEWEERENNFDTEYKQVKVILWVARQTNLK